MKKQVTLFFIFQHFFLLKYTFPNVFAIRLLNHKRKFMCIKLFKILFCLDDNLSLTFHDRGEEVATTICSAVKDFRLSQQA